jgi:pimeloyl-ACP methyl ester carboxylesterase
VDARERTDRGAVSAPVLGELRYGLELGRLLAQPRFHSVAPGHDPLPVLLVPGFLAGDASLVAMAGWLRRRGHRVHRSGILMNVGCAGAELDRLSERLSALDGPVIVVGQSRGGTLGRALAARHPESVAGLVTLGSPVLDPLAVSAPVLRTVRSVARLGDLGMRGVFTSECADGECCAEFNRLLAAPLRPDMQALAIYSTSDGIVDWRACLDPSATCVEVEGSHCGMGVNAQVYRELEGLLERLEVARSRR